MLKLDQINFSFKDRPILKNVSLEIKENSFVAITGKSGSGKTTLLGIISGLLKPLQGKVFYQGKNIYKWGDFKRSKFRNREIGFIFQFFNLFPEMTAYENILYPALLNPFSASKSLAEVNYLIDFLDLKKIKDQYPQSLSGGERQRVAVARALVNNPKFILADEPTGNLDKKSSLNILNLFLELKKEKGISIIVVTHEDKIVKKADQHYHLEDNILEKVVKKPKNKVAKKIEKDKNTKSIKK